jgi:dTDP-4-amino-4,6-dideoxygalactose transaminase
LGWIEDCSEVVALPDEMISKTARGTTAESPKAAQECQEIPLSRPDISEADIQAVTDVLRTPFLSLGPKLTEFEEAFCAYTGARFATATSSGTAALHLVVRGLGIGPGDEVITTPFSFVASANCILFERATPVFVDVDPISLNLDPALIERQISSRTKAILVVHIFGRPANMDEILQIARRYDLRVIEDACEALGASWGGRSVGTIGDAGTFAFYPNKQITTGEGGLIVTNDAGLDRLFKSLRNQGRSADGAWLQHERLGFNYRLSEINCALGISQLSRLDGFLRRRREVAELYRRYLADLDELELPPYEIRGAEISWFLYVARLRGATRPERDALLRKLRERGIACSDYFSPIHLQPHFQALGHGPGEFPVAEAAADSTVALPFFNQLQEEQIQRTAAAIRQALQ